MDKSPCVRNCCLDQQDICLGCGRGVDEIMEWHNANAQRRTQIIQLAHQRQVQRAKPLAFKHPAVTPSE